MNFKPIILLMILIGLFLVYLYMSNREISYIHTFELEKFKIEEEYDKDKKIYSYNIIYGKEEYEFSISGDYTDKRGLITKINIKEDCLDFKGDLNFYQICKKNDIYYFDYNFDKEIVIQEEGNIKVHSDFENNIYLWNYNEFIKISGKEINKISIFENDVYSPALFEKLDSLLFIPDYDQGLYFNKYYILDMENGTVRKEEISSEINTDLHYTNYESNILSVYDKKNNKVYQINVSNNDVKIKNRVEYTDKELDKLETNNKEEYFKIDNNSILYEFYQTKISLLDMDITEIIHQNEEEVYFLSSTKLYVFNIYDGLELLLESSEWEFNYKNLIYIY